VLRFEQAFTFDAFVEETSLGRGYISELERGLVVPTVRALAQIAKALDITIADLVLGDTDRERLFAETRTVSAARVRKLRAILSEYVVEDRRSDLASVAERTPRRDDDR
jgi:transcriptional regulator with XRE-family HTH domain